MNEAHTARNPAHGFYCSMTPHYLVRSSLFTHAMSVRNNITSLCVQRSVCVCVCVCVCVWGECMRCGERERNRERAKEKQGEIILPCHLCAHMLGITLCLCIPTIHTHTHTHTRYTYKNSIHLYTGHTHRTHICPKQLYSHVPFELASDLNQTEKGDSC